MYGYCFMVFFLHKVHACVGAPNVKLHDKRVPQLLAAKNA